MPLKDDDRPTMYNDFRKFSWQCPRLGCKKFILAYTESGLRTLKDLHLDDHSKEDREVMRKFQEALKNIPSRNYDVLILTWEDINFLSVRGIAIDEQIEYDPGLKRQVCFDEGITKTGAWARILEKMWLQSQSKFSALWGGGNSGSIK